MTTIVDVCREYDAIQDQFLRLLKAIRLLPPQRREFYFRKADQALNNNNSAASQQRALEALEKEIAHVH